MNEKTKKLLKHYSLLWAGFCIIFTLAIFALELIEGNKITTTEYYGLMNLGFVIIFIEFIAILIFYPITFFPITLLFNWFIRSNIAAVVLFTIMGCVSGWWIFQKLYADFDNYFVDGYGLNVSTAIILFGAAALLYGILNAWLRRIVK